MRDRKKRNIMIASLCCLLVFMGIGYALLTQILTINGTATLTGDWRIEITNIKTAEIVGSAENAKDENDNPISPTFTKDEATFAVNFVKPGDKIVYEVTVKNFGTIDAVLSLNASLSLGVKDVAFTNTLESGTILKGGEEITFEVEAKFSEVATTIATGAVSKYKIVMIYTQYDGNELYDPSNTETDNGLFKVENGVITDYNADLGTHVSIPATIDGKAVTSISSDAFKIEKSVYNYDLKVALTSEGVPQFAVLFNEDVRDELMELTGGTVPVYSVGDSNIPELSEGVGYGYYNYSADLLSTPPVLETDSNFLGESSVVKTLAIKSVDLSNATNLEKIEPFAFSNADLADLANGNVKEGITNLTFGNNTNKIQIGAGAFAGANIDFLKTYASLEFVIDPSIYEYANSEDSGFEGGNDFVSKAAPFAYSTIGRLMIDSFGTESVIKTILSLGILNSPVYAGIKEVNELIINEGISEIQTGSFAYTKVNTVSFPSTLKIIGEHAFDSCGLTSVNFNYGIEEIAGYAFTNNNLTSVEIPSSITTISSLAFYSNPNLTTITINKSEENVTVTGGDRWPTGTEVIFKS